MSAGRPDAAVAGTDAGPIGGDVRRLAQARPVWARPLSLRSFALKLRFKDGGNGVFKPLRRGDGTARHEVAYFRLAEELGVGFVPASTMRLVPLDRFERLLKQEHPEVAEELAAVARVDDRRRVRGALIEWVDGLRPTPLAAPGSRPQLEKLLALDGPAPQAEPLAPALAAVVSFDFVMGNWDRFTGGNLFLDERGSGLVLIDNNAAFDRWSAGQQQRMERLLDSCFRYPTRLIERLRTLDRDRIERALAREPSHQDEPLLSAAEIDRILQRRDLLIAHVDELIAEHGLHRVLAFP